MAFSLDALVLGPCISAFGEKAQGKPLPVYTPVGGAPFTLDGVFDEEHRDLDILQGPTISSSSPVLGVRFSQFPAGIAPAQGDALRIRGRNFLIRDVQPDGQGHAKLLLNEVGAFTPGAQFLG